jgi:hypothetical protein
MLSPPSPATEETDELRIYLEANGIDPASPEAQWIAALLEHGEVGAA